MTALATVARARREQTALPPNVLASALRDMSRMPDHPFGELEVGPRAWPNARGQRALEQTVSNAARPGR
eukprot:7069164-Pyramimonas_sp.AAC.1